MLLPCHALKQKDVPVVEKLDWNPEYLNSVPSTSTEFMSPFLSLHQFSICKMGEITPLSHCLFSSLKLTLGLLSNKMLVKLHTHCTLLVAET